MALSGHCFGAGGLTGLTRVLLFGILHGTFLPPEDGLREGRLRRWRGGSESALLRIGSHHIDLAWNPELDADGPASDRALVLVDREAGLFGHVTNPRRCARSTFACRQRCI